MGFLRPDIGRYFMAKFTENLGTLSQQSVLGSWLGIIAYALHIYLDFSAYSDMAIGMGRMLGNC